MGCAACMFRSTPETSERSRSMADPAQPAWAVEAQGLVKTFGDTEVVKGLDLKVRAGSIFGILVGASTVYLALKAGLTVSASIPIAVLAITLARRLFRTTILENNIIQTTGSASESIAAGVVFTLPGFLFLSTAEAGNYFNYAVIFILAIFGGMLGTLLMIPLRRSLIVKEHETLPYPEGTACAAVLKAGEKGGDFGQRRYAGGTYQSDFLFGGQRRGFGAGGAVLTLRSGQPVANLCS